MMGQNIAGYCSRHWDSPVRLVLDLRSHKLLIWTATIVYYDLLVPWTISGGLLAIPSEFTFTIALESYHVHLSIQNE